MTAPRLLLVDDSAVARATLRSALDAVGYDVVEAEDGGAAVTAAAEHNPDLVLLDMELPVLDGMGVLAALRDNPELRDIPVIVLSGLTDTTAVTAALRAGALDYVTKPFDPAAVIARVAGALRTRALVEDLRRRNAELTAFAWRASHDLKTPMAVIKGMADTLTTYEDRLDVKTKHDLLGRIGTAAEQAAGMIEGLLALARHAEQAADGPAFTPDPEAVVRGIVDEARLEEADIELGGRWDAVALPASDFGSVVQNLVVNASFYGRSADGRLRLRIHAEPDADRLVLTVADQGRGVPLDAAARLFDPFFRGNDSRDFNPRSTGIGLAIVRRTVERWGGSVELAKVEVGACFRLNLPKATREGMSE
jgi:two-component system sensor histidine kinase/response regulator